MSIESSNEAQAGEHLECVNKLMEIEVIRHTAENVGKIYSSVKSQNFLFSLCLNTAEKSYRVVFRGVRPVLNTFQGPIKLADLYACKVLAGVQENVPVILGTPTSILTSTYTTVLNSAIGQLILSGADKMLCVAERVVTLVPEISVTDVDTEDDKQETATTILEQVKSAYSLATTPLQLTGKLIHGTRDVIKQFKKEEAPIAKELQPRGLVERILNIPVKGLHYIGMLSEKRSICNRQRDSELRLSPDECNKELEDVQKQWSILDSSESSNSTKSTYLSQEENENEVPARSATEPESLEVRHNSDITRSVRTKVGKPIKPLPVSRKLGQVNQSHAQPKINAIRKPVQSYKDPTRVQNKTSTELRSVKSNNEARRNSTQTKPSRVVTG